MSDSPTVTVNAAAMSESGSTAIEHLLNTLPDLADDERTGVRGLPQRERQEGQPEPKQKTHNPQ